jgi:acyl-CoA hydrolase
MVAVDETGAPVPVPPLVPATDRERKWFTGAIARRAALKAAFAD